MKALEPVLVIGAGKMGGAILSAWLESASLESSSFESSTFESGSLESSSLESDDAQDGFDPASVYVEDPGAPEDVVDLLAKFDVHPKPRHELPGPPGLVMLAVKPQVMEPVLIDLAARIGPSSLIYSIAAGKTLADLAKHLPEGTAIIRAMPNTPVMVAAGMTALICNEHVSAEQRGLIERLVAGTGQVAWLEDEAQMDAVTAVSGSGPAYVYYLTECLAKAGEAQGLPASIAMQLARATVSGAGAMMATFDTEAEDLRQNVTSKGGTTAAALEVLMADDGLAPLMDAAIVAATKRSKELSG